MTRKEFYQMKDKFISINVFRHVITANGGSYDYSTQENFLNVLKRVEELELGINGIEVWKNGEFFDVQTSNSKKQAYDPSWYYSIYFNFCALNEDLEFLATYDVPIDRLDRN